MWWYCRHKTTSLQLHWHHSEPIHPSIAALDALVCLTCMKRLEEECWNPAGVQQDNWKPTGRIHGKLTEIRELISIYENGLWIQILTSASCIFIVFKENTFVWAIETNNATLVHPASSLLCAKEYFLPLNLNVIKQGTAPMWYLGSSFSADPLYVKQKDIFTEAYSILKILSHQHLRFRKRLRVKYLVLLFLKTSSAAFVFV